MKKGCNVPGSMRGYEATPPVDVGHCICVVVGDVAVKM